MDCNALFKKIPKMPLECEKMKDEYTFMLLKLSDPRNLDYQSKEKLEAFYRSMEEKGCFMFTK